MMRSRCLAVILALSACQTTSAPEPIQSRLIQAEAEDLILLQEVVVKAPVCQVWQAYTTEEGWATWASPTVSIDLRAGGLIQTHYGAGAKIGDPGTITLHIVNYVPERLLTLQADAEERWPDVMKEDASNLMNVILFESLSEDRTRIMSYGLGYRDTEAYNKLMGFFIPANEQLLEVLRDSMEN